jgi:hypothetical protein
LSVESRRATTLSCGTVSSARTRLSSARRCVISSVQMPYAVGSTPIGSNGVLNAPPASI